MSNTRPQRVSYVFNSALTALSNKTGEFDEKKFNQTILPLQGKLMQMDGLTACKIERYGVSVTFFQHVTTEEAVKMHVLQVFQNAATKTTKKHKKVFFPLLGDKTLEISPDSDNSDKE